MQKQDVISKGKKFGDFYAYYKSQHKSGRQNRNVYLVGTLDFDNKYIQRMAKDRNVDLSNPITDESVLVFSWTNNRFRWLKLADMVRMIPLANELRRAKRTR